MPFLERGIVVLGDDREAILVFKNIPPGWSKQIEG